MPHISLHCAKCNVEAAAYDTEDQRLLNLWLAAHHVDQNSPHTGHHRLVPMLDGQPLQGGTHELHFICLSCPHNNSYVYPNVPLELCSGLIVCAHTEHEGHPCLVKLDGQQIHPPLAGKGTISPP